MSPMDRRRFLKVTAVTGATAALAQCGNPENQIVRFIPDDDLVPGVAEWKPSICTLCPASCGVIARVMEGDAKVVRNGQAGVIRMGLVKKLEGNPDDPISQGRLCVRGQAGVQVTYHPERLRQPMKRAGERGSGRFEPIEWDDAIRQLAAALDGIATSPADLAFVGRPRGPRRHGVTAAFLQRFGAPPAILFEPFGDEVLREANLRSFGQAQLPTLDVSRTRYLVAFGADFLGTWNSPIAQGASYGRMRQGTAGVRGKFVQVEPRMSTTGANADEWVPIRPGTDGVLALGLAHAIMAAGLRPAASAGSAGALIDGWAAGLPDFTPARVEEITGVAAARVERLAKELAANAPAAVVIGGVALAHTNGLVQALAVNALNALVGSVGQPGGLQFTPGPGTSPAQTTLRAALATSPKVLLLDDANPVFAAAPALKVRDWVARVPFIASFGSFVDETSVLADLLLPDHSFLESWVDRHPDSGAAAPTRMVTAPAMRPLHHTRQTPDVLLDVSRALARPFDPPMADSFATIAQAEDAQGVAAPGATASGRGSAAAPAVAYEAARFDGDAAEFPFIFQPYPSQAFLDGSLAHLPWLQELPDPLTSAMWSTWVELNPHTAERLGIHDGDLVEVASTHGSLRAPAVVSPGIAPDVLAMPVGQGHEHFTRVASGRGANPLAILADLRDAATGAPAWAATRVKVARAGDADGSLILFAGATRERPEEGIR